MNINEGDIIKLRKDIERVRKHEESRRARETPERKPSSLKRRKAARPRSISICARLRRALEDLLEPPGSSKESLQTIPDHVVTLLQAIAEEPKFGNWIIQIDTLPETDRNQLLEKMSFAFRIEDAESSIAAGFERLKDQALFKAFCQTLRDEGQVSA
jgi:hypothetical protein